MLTILPTPARLPAFPTILDDIGRPSAADLAHALGVPVAAVRRWTRAEAAPRPVMLALYWLTRWGRHELDSRLAFEATNAAQLASSLRRELAQAEERLQHLAALDYGAANAPLRLQQLVPARPALRLVR